MWGLLFGRQGSFSGESGANLPEVTPPKSYSLEKRYVIIDETGMYPLTKSERSAGVRDGYLELEGWHRDGIRSDILVVRYRLLPPD